MTGVNKDNRTATLKIKKDIEIANTENLPQMYKNIDANKIRKNFEFGNTTLYVKELPVNNSPVEFIKKKAWKKGDGYALDVVYDVSTKLIDPSNVEKTGKGDRGRISTVFVGIESQFKKNGEVNKFMAAKATHGKDYNTSIFVNESYIGDLSAEDIITHEGGDHNMKQNEHKLDKNGNPIYPTKGLESNVEGKIKPTQEDTKQIINVNLQEGRLDTE